MKLPKKEKSKKGKGKVEPINTVPVQDNGGTLSPQLSDIDSDVDLDLGFDIDMDMDMDMEGLDLDKPLSDLD